LPFFHLPFHRCELVSGSRKKLCTFFLHTRTAFVVKKQRLQHFEKKNSLQSPIDL